MSKLGIIGRAGVGLASGLLASSALTSAAFAQVAATNTAAASGVQEVIVTASKRSENIQKVPISVQALDARALTQLNVTDFQDYVKYTPSLTYQTAGPNQTTVYMRGVSSGGDGNHSGPLPSVGTYLDEQPITTIGGTLDIHVYDIARVEVLPGPQGTLYGASSEAGTLRIITNKPSTAGFSAGYDIQGNTVDHGGQGYVAEGFINVPLANNMAVRIVGWDEHDAGYIDNVLGSRTFPTSGDTVTNANLVKKNFNPADTYGARAALKIDLDDNWTITPSIIAQDQRNKGVFGYEPSVGELQAERFQPDTDHDRWVQAALTVAGKIGKYDLTYSGGYFTRRVDTKSDYTDYSISYDNAFGSGYFWQDAAGNPLPRPLQEIYGLDQFKKDSQELRIASPSTDRLRLIGGLFYERQTHAIIQDYEIQGFGPQIAVPGFPNTIWLTDQMRVDRDDAVFGEAAYDITPKLTFTAGIRGYEYKNQLHGFYGFSQGYDALTGFSSGMGDMGQNCIAGLKYRDAPCVNLNKYVSGSGETHKLNLSYKFDDQRMIYATYSTGYRPGGINRNGDLPPYAADKLSNYELGLKSTWFDHKLRFNAAIYDEEWDKFQFSFLGLNSLTVIQNGPSASIKGAEATVDWYPIDHLSISAGGSYNDARAAKFCGADSTGKIIGTCSNADAVILKNAQLPYTPAFKGDLVVRYNFDAFGWNSHAQASATYSSKTQFAIRQDDLQYIGPGPGDTVVDVSVGAQKGNLSLELFVKNLFDTRLLENRYTPCTTNVCGATYPGVPTATYVVPIQPMTIGFKIGQKF